MVDCTKSDQYDFSLCSIEADRLKDWLLTHKCKVHLGGLSDVDTFLTSRWVAVFRQSAVGPSINIICDCGEEVDINHWEHA